MEKKPTKKKVYKQYSPLIINSSEHSDQDSDSNYQPVSPPKTKQNKKMIQSINDVEYQGNINKTFTKDLTKDEIKALLDGYKRVEHHELQKGFNIRYFIKDKDTGNMLFRTGGMITLIVIEKDKQYIVVSGGRTFSVQLNPTTVFFQQQPLSEVVRDLNETFEIQKEKLDDKIEKITKENAILLKHNKMMVKEMAKKDKQIQKLEGIIKKQNKN